jgi:UDP-glucose 4-epimerase
MKLLVAGGAGYIGSVVSHELVRAGHEVTVLDDLSTGHRDAVPAGCSFVQGDVRHDSDEVLRDQHFDGVLHFAAKSLVGESVTDPATYWEVNLGGSLALVRAAVAHGVPRFVFSSTAATYGDPDTVPIAETATERPTSPYGASKLAVDHMLGGMCHASSLGGVSLRYFNVAGAVGPYGERHTVETHLIPNVLAAAGGGAEQVSIFGDDWPTPDGTCIRDYIHVADLAAAHLLALDACRPGRHRVYNLGTGVGYSVREVIQAAERVVGHPIPTAVSPRRPGDPAVLVASGDRASDELGWRPTRGLDDMVQDAWDFHRGLHPVA